ncbi:uncharacterized protein BO66DRAFT_439770 [Aspergillus aculeatinus CBS 121060]|uniref:Uncharacterized protein n=1 Tax=Aspergillus aculeatinus CBS 121060 TaxID=1448322 RepID=A0ACD1H5A1_9EURO|nr:hypothetical protein BO66DRAFT_439770 [Aspergillus aculeatinus CBS 121060]RAH68759.1 hypothetical protein BO66DRAFT_439770 [Aspergillus aculeatinus CBS 121060]
MMLEKQPLDNTVPCSPPSSERSLEQQMELSPLELSFSRQLEVYLTVALPVKLTPEECLAATRQMITEYPILGTRLNMKAGFAQPHERGLLFKLGTTFRARTVNLRLDEFVPSNTAELCSTEAEPEPVFYDPQILEKLVRFKGGKHDGRQVLSIRTIHLRDACVIQFIVQHALSDAGGIHWIAKTYCALLSGTHVRGDTAIRPEFFLKTEVIEAGQTAAAHADTPNHPIAVRYSQGFQVSWARFLVAYLRQRLWAFCPTSARRVRRMLFVPQSRIDEWMAQAQSRGVQVTEHDLLMAFIYQSAFSPTAKEEEAHTGLIFTLNIQSHLASAAGALTNPWINVPVAPVAPASSASDDLVDIAHHIRQTIQDARDPVCVAQIIDQHLPVRDTPAVPRGYGSRTPRVALTSWCHLPWYGLDVKGTRPVFVLGNTRLSRPLTKIGVRMDDGLTTCKARASARMGNADGDGDEGRQAGYWVQGRVNQGIWSRMMGMLKRSEEEDGVNADKVVMDKV